MITKVFDLCSRINNRWELWVPIGIEDYVINSHLNFILTVVVSRNLYENIIIIKAIVKNMTSK